MGYEIPDEYYRFLFENSLDAIMLTSPDGRIYRANPAACDMLGRSEEEIIKLGRNYVVDSEDPRLEPALKEREEKGKAEGELYLKRRDGTKFPIYFTSAIFYDDQDRRWAVIIARDITKTKKTEETLRKANKDSMEISRNDYLTGLLNRRGFVERLDEEMQRSERTGKAFGILMMDLDLFKNINDEYGHSVGDIVLKEVAKTLAKSLRPYDFIGRHGGDEFIICLPETDKQEIILIAERLRKAIAEMTLAHERVEINVTGSFGISEYHPDSKVRLDNLISTADNNMYKAKRIRNSIYFMD